MLIPSRLGKCAVALAALWVLPWLGAFAETPAPAPPPSFLVDTTADVLDAAFACASVTEESLPGPDGAVSLREAICAANRRAGSDAIAFDLASGSVIRLFSPLPPIEDDGTDLAGDTAPGFAANVVPAPGKPTLRPSVQIDATALPAGTPVIRVRSGGNRLAGLAVTGPGDGLVFEGQRSVRNRVEAMWLGASIDPSIPHGLGGAGVRASGAAANLIGGLGIREGNLFRETREGVVAEAAVRIKVLGNAMEGLLGEGIVLTATLPGDTLSAPLLDADSTSTLALVGRGVPAGALIDLYLSGPPGAPAFGQRHLGAFTEGSGADADHVVDGRFTFPLSGLDVAAGDRITVTATDGVGNTSPFANPVAARPVDSDRDGLLDEEETAQGLDPFSPDTDGDGVSDAVEACRCSIMIASDDPVALVEVSSVTGRVLRRVALPLSAAPVTGLALGRGAAGPVVAVATPRGAVLVDLVAATADTRLVSLRSDGLALPVPSGRPAASADGTRVYIPRLDGYVSVVHLPTRLLEGVVPSAGSPGALAIGDGALMAVTFAGVEPGLGLYSLAEPERPALLSRLSSLGGSALVSDTVMTAPVALEGSRFTAAVGGDRDPLLAFFSPSGAVTHSIPAATATVPVAVTRGPAASQVSVALSAPDGSAGAVVTLGSAGALEASTPLDGRPAGIAVSGMGGLVVPMSDGRVILLPGSGASASAVEVAPAASSGALGLAAPSTGTDPLAASSGPGVAAALAPGAVLPVQPAPLGAARASAAPAPPAARVAIEKAIPTGGLPAKGSAPASALRLPRPTVPRAALTAAALPAAPGTGFPAPRSVVLAAPQAVRPEPGTGLWLMAAACAGFLVGALVVQPRPGTLGARRRPSLFDDPQAAIFGPARRWDHWIAPVTR